MTIGSYYRLDRVAEHYAKDSTIYLAAEKYFDGRLIVIPFVVGSYGHQRIAEVNGEIVARVACTCGEPECCPEVSR